MNFDNILGNKMKLKPGLNFYADFSYTWCDENGKVHRDGDYPAKIWKDGTMWFMKHGKVHRDGNKPAKIYVQRGRTVKLEYWVDGKKIREVK